MPVMAELIVPSRALCAWLSPACKAEFCPYGNNTGLVGMTITFHDSMQNKYEREMVAW